jgi:hypothetical protein
MQNFYLTMSPTNWQGRLSKMSARDLKSLEKKSRAWLYWPG